MKILFPISLIFTSIIVFFLITDPLYKDVKQLKIDMSTYDSALLSANDLKDKRDALLEKYRNIKQEDKDRLEVLLPNTVSNIKFVLEIERIANLHGIPLKDIKFDGKNLPENKDVTEAENAIVLSEEEVLSYKPYGIFPIEFATEGNYESFLSFLKDLELNLRLMDIKSISFTVPDETAGAGGATSDPNVYNFIIKVDTYWLK